MLDAGERARRERLHRAADRARLTTGRALIRTVIGRLTAVKSGHALNHQLVRRVLAEPDACEVVQPRAEDELHALQESLLPVLALEEQVA